MESVARPRIVRVLHEVRHRAGVFVGAVGLSLMLFIVLPVIQTISKPLTTDVLLQTVDTANLEPPPPAAPEEEPPPEAEPEEQPPELVEEAAPLDLSQLEVVLNPGFGGDWAGAADFAVKLNSVVAGSAESEAEAVFSMADLDQKPTIVYQPGPAMSKELRRKAPGKVNVIFIVDENGRVADARVRSSSDPVFEDPALKAVQKWKFEPGKRGGRAVRFRMLAPITFPEG